MPVKPKGNYAQLANLPVLRQGWHVVRSDARSDFLPDPLQLTDYGFNLDRYLTSLSKAIRSGTYQPRVPRIVDIPKSPLSVRPGTFLDIDDRVILHAIFQLVGPRLDAALPAAVKSSRAKRDKDGNVVLADSSNLSVTVLRRPFLKGQLIRREISLIEPWYEAWPQFQEELLKVARSGKYPYLLVTDVSSYFENIDLNILRNLLLKHLPGEQQIVNFLIRLLESWTWPAEDFSPSSKGIPQGNMVSSFLGNFYLQPVDESLTELEQSMGIKYARWVDDLEVFCPDLPTARRVLFVVNERLRGLRLNIQSAKTQILEGPEMLTHLSDPLLGRTNQIIKRFPKVGPISSKARQLALRHLAVVVRALRPNSKKLTGSGLRVFRRLVTAYYLLQSASLVGPSLTQFVKTPDHRLIQKVALYLTSQDRTLPRVRRDALKMLSTQSNLFSFQEAQLYRVLRHTPTVPLGAWQLALNRIAAPDVDWMVKQQCALLLSVKVLSKNEIRAIYQVYRKERDAEAIRGYVQCLCQTRRDEFVGILNELQYSDVAMLRRVSHFYRALLEDESAGLRHVSTVFSKTRDDLLTDRLGEIEVLSQSRHPKVQLRLRSKLLAVRPSVRRPSLAFHLRHIRRRL
jgi:hypothetical protein